MHSALSDRVSFTLQTADAGLVGRGGARLGDDMLVSGQLAHNLWQEAASAPAALTSKARALAA